MPVGAEQLEVADLERVPLDRLERGRGRGVGRRPVQRELAERLARAYDRHDGLADADRARAEQEQPLDRRAGGEQRLHPGGGEGPQQARERPGLLLVEIAEEPTGAGGVEGAGGGLHGSMVLGTGSRITGVADPLSDRDALEEALRLVTDEATRYLEQLDGAPVRPPAAEPGGPADAPLPLEGDGALVAVRELIEASADGATRSAGPRFFHFVMGGGTPAALAADWWTSAIDQIAFNWVSSPFAMRIEQVAVAWLQELFGLPAAWSGAFTSGATTANFTGLAAARRWWGLQQGVDVEEQGLSALPPVPVLGSGFVHASAIKALAMLGIGRRQVQTFVD